MRRKKKMSDFGLLASRFSENTILLRKFDEALRYFKDKEKPRGKVGYLEQKENLLYVLRPVSETIEGMLSKSTVLDEQKIVDILKRRRITDWQRYKEQIVKLTSRISSEDVSLGQGDFELLNDVADAIDIECASLFRRISGRP
jgi:hypothetical protein